MSKKSRKTQSLEDQIYAELRKHNFSSRRETATTIKETFGIELSVSGAGRLLKKWGSKGEKLGLCPQKPIG